MPLTGAPRRLKASPVAALRDSCLSMTYFKAPLHDIFGTATLLPLPHTAPLVCLFLSSISCLGPSHSRPFINFLRSVALPSSPAVDCLSLLLVQCEGPAGTPCVCCLCSLPHLLLLRRRSAHFHPGRGDGRRGGGEGGGAEGQGNFISDIKRIVPKRRSSPASARWLLPLKVREGEEVEAPVAVNGSLAGVWTH